MHWKPKGLKSINVQSETTCLFNNMKRITYCCKFAFVNFYILDLFTVAKFDQLKFVFILVVIDIASKTIKWKILANKEAATVSEAMTEIFGELNIEKRKFYLANLTNPLQDIIVFTDWGPEWMRVNIPHLKMWHLGKPYSDNTVRERHIPNIDRLFRTLRSKIRLSDPKPTTQQEYIKQFSHECKIYNLKHDHSTIKSTPMGYLKSKRPKLNVWEFNRKDDNLDKNLQKLSSKFEQFKSEFPLGAKIRIRRERSQFEKSSDLQHWSSKVYRIAAYRSPIFSDEPFAIRISFQNNVQPGIYYPQQFKMV